MSNLIVQGDNLEYMNNCDLKFQLIYIDPPFNTGKEQKYRFKNTVKVVSYNDNRVDYLKFMKHRLQRMKELLLDNGSLFVHLDYRESHYVKILLDDIFGRNCFMNEIIWAYDFGGRSKNKWSAKHDTILWYVKDPQNYIYNYDRIDRIPYMAPTLAGKEKAKRGKTPTDVWWCTIVHTTGKERVNYVTQKPMKILRRIIRVHVNPGDLVGDFFAGSGTTGAVAQEEGLGYVMVDENPDAIEIMKKRLTDYVFLKV